MDWKTAAKFWTALLAWTAGIYAFLALVSLTSPHAGGERIIGLVGWGGVALLLATFPAGLAVSNAVLRERVEWKRWLGFAAVAVSASLVLLILSAWIGPVMVSSLGGVDVAGEPAAMHLGELRAELQIALEQVRAIGPGATQQDWIRANQLAWHYFSRLDGSVLPLLIAWFGVFVGYWIRLVPRKEFRQAQLWGIGILLVITTYFAGENSYEMIVLRSAGFAGFAADLRLIVPMVLVAVLGWPTFLSLWSRSQQG